MALFSKKDKKEQEQDKKQNEVMQDKSADKNASEDVSLDDNKVRLRDIIISPRITEKSVKLMDKGVYTFNVRKDANKTEIAKAIKEIYKVEPVKVRIVNYPAKKKYNYKSGKFGEKKGGKKALVYLKEGDKISII